jgi:hypothetical protein
VQSIILAGINSPIDFETGGIPVTEGATHPAETTLPAGTGTSLSITSLIPMQPGISIQAPVPQETQRLLA